MKRILLAFAAIAMAAGANAQVENGQYCIRNMEQGSWLNSGHSWGTAAVTSPVARVFEVVNNGDGSCKVKSTLGFWKGGGEIFLDGNEGDAANFEFVKEGENYLIKHDGKFFAVNEKFDFKDGDWWNWEKACHQDTQWTIKLVDNSADAAKWDIITLADMKENLKNATAEAPVDATFFIKANNMSKNDSDNLSAWECTKGGEKSEIMTPDPNWIYGDNDGWAHQDTFGFFLNDKHENDAADSDDMVMQTAEGLPAGDYDMVYRVVNQTNTPFELDVNGTKCPVVDYTDLDLWYHSAADALKTGEKTAAIKVAADGKLNIKMSKQSKAGQQNRFAFKSFRIYYKGNSESGVGSVIADEDAPVEYYNLQGIRVANPERGIYVVRQGAKVSKRVIR